jgi:hypothetical protein
MRSCAQQRVRFSGYLDGRISGVEMQELAAHLSGCAACSQEFSGLRHTQSLLASLGPAKAPEHLQLKLRVALSRERARSGRETLSRWQVRWQNAVCPAVLRVSAGLASAVLLLGSFALMVGMFAAPQPVEARDVPLIGMSDPHLLYTAVEPDHAIGQRENPLIVEAYVDAHGRVYDYRIVAGDPDAEVRSELENVLLFSVFSPARSFDQPVRGTAVLAFSGVDVKG